jgi:hypothetical protein
MSDLAHRRFHSKKTRELVEDFFCALLYVARKPTLEIYADLSASIPEGISDPAELVNLIEGGLVSTIPDQNLSRIIFAVQKRLTEIAQSKGINTDIAEGPDHQMRHSFVKGEITDYKEQMRVILFGLFYIGLSV